MADTTSRTLPILPLPAGVVLPGMVVTIGLESDEARSAVDAAGDAGRSCSSPASTTASPASASWPTSRTSAPCPTAATPSSCGPSDGSPSGSACSAPARPCGSRSSDIDEPAPTDRTDDLVATYRATARSLLERIGGRRLTGMLRDIDSPGALADTAGWWPDLSLERKVELLETIDVDAAPREGHRLDQGGARRVRAGREDPHRRHRGHGEAAAGLPAAPAARRHPQGAGRRRRGRGRRRGLPGHARRDDRARRRPDRRSSARSTSSSAPTPSRPSTAGSPTGSTRSPSCRGASAPTTSSTWSTPGPCSTPTTPASTR